MKRALLLLVVMAAPVVAFGAASAAEIDRLIPELMREGDVPGLVIVTVKNGRIDSARSFGVASSATGEPLRTEAVFESASLAKPVFAYAVLKLVDAGLLSLDRPLSTVLPPPINDERMTNLTARMVLSHTTGLQNEVMPGQTLSVHFEPGSRFSYSGAGFTYLQRVVEHVTGKRLPSLMHDLVFEPLRMRQTDFVWRDAYDRLKVFGHTAAGTVNPRRKPGEPALAMMHTTAGDYALFLVAVMKGAGLRRGTAKAMFTPQIPLHEGCAICLDDSVRHRSENLSWGLGWGLERTARGTAFWHWAENNGDTQHFAVGYRDGRGLVILTNSGNGLSIIPAIVTATLGEHALFAWLGYGRFNDPPRRVWRDILAHGVPSALASALAANLTEPQLNRLGYMLLERKQYRDAIAVFRRNVERFPRSANVYDSLGEAYAAAGETEQAIANYERSLELDRHNVNAAEMLRKLRR